MRKLIGFVACLLIAGMQLANAQQGTATGVVKDTRGETLPGASVVVKNAGGATPVGTTTGIDGDFSIGNVMPGSTLVVSFVGYRTQETVWNGQPIEVVLKEDSQNLDEVIVVGYTTQRKESLTGAMTNIKSEKLKDVTTPSVENMLNGKIPGVYVAPGSGQPGASGAVVIRGQASLSGTTAPLWVIDGVIVGSSAGQLNPGDIESLTILKDAASTAIYGSEGANGVIVVTTKKGKEGGMTINLSAKLGISRLDNGNLEVMNGSELYDYYASFQNASVINSPLWTPELRNRNFDWWDEATHTGFAQDYHASIAGGTDKLKSYFAIGYYNEDGAVVGYKYKRYNFRFNADYKPYSWLTIKPSISGARRDITDKQRSVTSMYSMLPWDSPYDKDGNLVPNGKSRWWNAAETNYLFDLENGDYSESTIHEFMGNFDFDVRITDWLTFASVNSYRYGNTSEHSYTDPRSSGSVDEEGDGVYGRLEENRTEYNRKLTTQKLLFNKTFADRHAVNGLVAYEYKDYWGKPITAKGTGFVPGYEVLDVTAKPEYVGGSLSEWKVQSFLTKWNYAFDNRYLAEFSYRRDGASNLGDDKRYGNLFSVSAGWIISRENWFKASWVDNLKLRASYGSVGNRPSALYPEYDLYSVSASYNGVAGALISSIGNKDLTWERTYTAGVGVDAAMFDSRLRITFDYYHKKTDNILYNVPVTGLVGVTSVYKNIGKMRNTGIELSLGGDIIKSKDWYWNIELNLSHNKNELRDLYKQMDANGKYVLKPIIIGDNSGIAGSANRLLEVGEPIDTYYLKKWAGVNPENGAPMWYKHTANGDETTSKYAEATDYKCGKANPDVFGGFSTTLTWKNLDLNAVFGFSIGGQIYNYSRQEYDSDGAYTDRNQMKLQSGWSRWQKPGDKATHPVAKYNNRDKGNSASSRYLEDSDFLKMRSLTLGYNIPMKKFGVQNLRVALSGENLFTITDYSGVDPEVPASGTTVMGTAGPGVYPSVRKFMFGLDITF